MPAEWERKPVDCFPRRQQILSNPKRVRSPAQNSPVAAGRYMDGSGKMRARLTLFLATRAAGCLPLDSPILELFDMMTYAKLPIQKNLNNFIIHKSSNLFLLRLKFPFE